MASQFFAVKGMRPKYDYTAAINAQTPYLPERYKYQKEQELQDKEFQQNQAYLDKSLGLQEDQFKQQKKDTKLANLIGVGKLGTDVYFASQAAKEPSIKSLSGVNPGAAASAAEAAKNGVSPLSKDEFAPIPKPGLMDKFTNFLAPNQTVNDLMTSNLDDWKTGLTAGNLLTGAGGGIIADQFLGGKKKKPWESALYGAGGGAIASYIGSGGDLYKTALGGLAGAGGSALGNLMDFF